MPRSTTLQFRIDSDLKGHAKRIAAADGRTLANWVKQLIRKEIENRERLRS